MESKKISKELRISLFAILCFILFFVGFRYLKGINPFQSNKDYHIMYSNVDGLVISNPVILNGYPVGRVKNIEILPENNNKLIVTITVDKKIQIFPETEVLIGSNGLISGKNIELKFTKKGKTPYSNGDTLMGTEKPNILNSLVEKAPKLIDRIDSISMVLNTGLAKILTNLDKSTALLPILIQNANQIMSGGKRVISANEKNIEKITANTQLFTKNLLELQHNLKPTLKNLNTFSDSLNKFRVGEMNSILVHTRNSLAQTEKMLIKMQTQGTLGKLIQTDSLHRNLNMTLASLNGLLVNFKENPKRYVHFSIFGRKENKETKENKKE